MNHYTTSTTETLQPCFRKADYALINAFLATIDWDEVYTNCNSTNEYWNAFKDIMNTAIYNFVPFVSSGKSRYTPWFNNNLKHLRSVKQRKWKRYLGSPSIVTHAQYKASACNFKNAFLKSKCEYEKNLFQNENCSGKFYGYVKRQTSVNNSIPCIKKADGTLTLTDYEKSCEFSNYFSSVFVKDNNVLPAFNYTCTDSLESFSCNVQSIIKVVMKLKNGSSSGPDGLSVLFIKKIIAVIANPLCKVFNKSLNEGVLPADWKTAHIVPVFKKGDSQSASQYRPISLTSVVCKILERIIRKKLLDYMLQNDIVPSEQHGFVPKKSTVTNLLECLNDWSLNFDKGVATNIIYLDYSKCFDTVCHNKLLYKISKYGITGQAYVWLSNFLLNRTQHVKINSSISPPAMVESGVPQGTVLGPILFLLYSADLPHVVRNCKISLYADDTKLYKSISNEHDCLLLQRDLDSIANWANSWQMSLNPDKTKMLSIGNCKVKFDYKLHGKSIENVTHISDVGVTVQSNLKFTVHCTNVIRKAYHVIRTIFTTLKYHDSHFYLKMYTCYVRPLLEYGSQVWSPLMKCNIDRIERVQRYYTRRICTNDMRYLDRLQELNIETLEHRRIKSDIVLFFKLISNVTSININEYYTFVHRHRGHNKTLYMYYSRTDKRKFYWINRIVKYWNSLNNVIVESSNVRQFKHSLETTQFIGRGSIYC
jgi:hypothetical protein